MNILITVVIFTLVLTAIYGTYNMLKQIEKLPDDED